MQCTRSCGATGHIATILIALFLLSALPGVAHAGDGFARLGLVAEVPEGWVESPPSSSMRLTEFVAGAVEVIVFYFGPGQGGPVEANIDRWVGQFRPVDGKPPVPVRDTFTTSGGFPVHWVEIRGDYARGVGTGPIGDYAEDQALLVAIVETPHDSLFIQGHGNRGAVEAAKAEFSGFVQSVAPGSQR